MKRPDSLAVACLAILAALLWPGIARSASGTLYFKQICAEMSDIPPLYGFETSFVGSPNCLNLCKQATVTCERNVKDAASCQIAFSNDWISFDSAVDCADSTGRDLSDCKKSWATDKKNWQAQIKQARGFALFACTQHQQVCQLRCTGQ